MAEVGILSAQDRVELIEGEIIDTTPIGPRHAAIVDRLAARLIRALPARYLVRIQNPLTLGDSSEPQPDLAIVADRSYAAEHPGGGDTHLVIEVADATVGYDRDVKLRLYAQFGIPEVWIVNLPAGQLEVFRDPLGDGYRQVLVPRLEELVTPLRIPEVSLRPGEVLAGG
jgi:Uma2 family endonuclease